MNCCMLHVLAVVSLYLLGRGRIHPQCRGQVLLTVWDHGCGLAELGVGSQMLQLHCFARQPPTECQRPWRRPGRSEFTLLPGICSDDLSDGLKCHSGAGL